MGGVSGAASVCSAFFVSVVSVSVVSGVVDLEAATSGVVDSGLVASVGVGSDSGVGSVSGVSVAEVTGSLFEGSLFESVASVEMSFSGESVARSAMGVGSDSDAASVEGSEVGSEVGSGADSRETGDSGVGAAVGGTSVTVVVVGAVVVGAVVVGAVVVGAGSNLVRLGNSNSFSASTCEITALAVS